MTMLNPDVDREIRRLLDLMPASGRMNCKLVPQPKQSSAIVVPLPLPWTVVRPIFINLSLWLELPLPERDMTLLRAVAWLGEVRWWKGGAYPALTVVGFMASGVELVQALLQGHVCGELSAGSGPAFDQSKDDFDHEDVEIVGRSHVVVYVVGVLSISLENSLEDSQHVNAYHSTEKNSEGQKHRPGTDAGNREGTADDHQGEQGYEQVRSPSGEVDAGSFCDHGERHSHEDNCGENEGERGEFGLGNGLHGDGED